MANVELMAPSNAVPVLAQPTVHAQTQVRTTGAFATPKGRTRYWILLGVLIVLALGFGVGLVTYENPMPVGTDGFWRIVNMRTTSLTAMAIVAFCQAIATVSFQTAVNNRIITPSIMGFESLYTAIQTGTIYFLGVAGLVAFQGTAQFVFQVAAMVALAVALYSWLLSGRYANIQVMLLIGIIIGAGLGSISTFMQRMLTPSEFDLLTARLFGNISNADAEYFPIAIPLCLVAGAALIVRARRLNLLALGRDAATGLGLNHRRETIFVLTMVAILMAVSTALVGPMVFLGFLVATLSYQIAGTHDHRYVFPIAALTGFVILSGAYFIMRHIFYAQGVVSIIIEVIGGTVFLIVILRKGRL